MHGFEHFIYMHMDMSETWPCTPANCRLYCCGNIFVIIDWRDTDPCWDTRYRLVTLGTDSCCDTRSIPVLKHQIQTCAQAQILYLHLLIKNIRTCTYSTYVTQHLILYSLCATIQIWSQTHKPTDLDLYSCATRSVVYSCLKWTGLLNYR